MADSAPERVEASRVAVIGLGAMGSRLAARLVHAGFGVVVWNRTAARTRPLAELGADVAASPADAARAADIILIMVSDPAALIAVTAGDRGVLAGVRPGSVLVVMATVGQPALRQLHGRMPAGVELLDVPVLGSLSEVEHGTLTLFLGGSPRAIHRATPVLTVLGTLRPVGPVGAGTAAKLVANSLLFGVVSLLGEGIALGHALGLGRDTIFDVLAATPLAAQAERRRTAITTGHFPPRFRLTLARKDADLVRAAAATAGLTLPVTQASGAWLAVAEAAGYGSHDYTAILAQILAGRGEQRRTSDVPNGSTERPESDLGGR